MNIVIDTHALLWYLTKDSKLSKIADSAIAAANKRFVPTIVLLELLYLLQKKKLSKIFLAIVERLKQDKKYTIISLDLLIVEAMLPLSDVFEMHDRIITATAKLLNVPVVTKDPVIKKIYRQTVW